MRTNRFYTALTILLAIAFAISLQFVANANTTMVASATFDQAMMVEFDFEEEAFINDIPFDTHCVSTKCKYLQAISEEFAVEEENYIDDIPFDTDQISQELSYESTLETVFEFEEEASIDDIPFDTQTVTQVYFQNHYTSSK